MASKRKRIEIGKINKPVAEFRKIDDSSFTIPTLSLTGRQMLPSGALFTTGERKGEVRGYKAYKTYVEKTFLPYNKDFIPLTQTEYEKAIYEFYEKYSNYTTDKQVISPVNLFTAEGQQEYRYQRAIYTLTRTPHIKMSEEEIRELSPSDLNKAFRIANEIREQFSYDSKTGENLYYAILDRVIDDIRSGIMREGEDYIEIDGDFNLTMDGIHNYVTEIRDYI